MASAAYRAGVELVDERTGQVHDYGRRSGVVMAQVILPDGRPADRGELWNAAEAAERRKDARTAREWVIALPAELDTAGRQALAQAFASELVNRYGVAADLAIHEPDTAGDQRNHHAHILLTTRQVGRGEDGALVLGEKASIELSDRKRRELGLGPAADEVRAVRELWEQSANAALERAGLAERIDARSLAAQGIEREPTIHLGPVASEMERRGRGSDRGDQLRAIASANVERQRVGAEIINLDRERLDRLPDVALAAEVKRREPPSFQAAAEQHPAIAPLVVTARKVAMGIALAQRAISRISAALVKHQEQRTAYQAGGGMGRRLRVLAARAGLTTGPLAASDRWIQGQQQRQRRAAAVLDARQKQRAGISQQLRQLAEVHRTEIEAGRRQATISHLRAERVLLMRRQEQEQQRKQQQLQRQQLRPRRRGPSL